MKIISCFVREQKRYNKNQLKSLFSYDENGVENFIRTLKSYGILKAVKNNSEQLDLSDLIEEDIEIAEESSESDSWLYVFKYVGVVVIGSRIIKCYPKYLLSKSENDVSLAQDMRQIIKVIEKYHNSSEQIINMHFNNGEINNFNILAIILYILNDYYENGVYSNSEDIIELNGEGSILWDRTINDGFAIFKNDKPYYIDTFTYKCIEDDEDYFKRLHECVITSCSRQLKKCHLEEMFEIEPVFLTDEHIEDFGDKEYVLDRLSKELNMQYNTRRQILLKTIYAYIANDGKLIDENNCISMFGTTAFNMVWEKVCSEVYNNKLNVSISSLHMKKDLRPYYKKYSKLIDIIEKPLWYCDDLIKESKDTLIPDIVSTCQKNDEDYFIILDAKYYNLQLEKNRMLKGNPGISDITKQYLYQLSFKKFLNDHEIKNVRNCFLMPTEQNKIINKGCVSLKMMKNLGLEDINIRLIPAKEIFYKYLSGKHMDLFDLEL